MRIVSYNILDGGEGRADPLAEVIEAQRPDVVALVEAEFMPVVERIAARLRMDFIHAPGRTKGASVLMSRWPIRSTINHAPLHELFEKSFLEATVETPDGGELSIGVIHLHAHGREDDERQRERELAVVMNVFDGARRAGRPHILAGDFNANSPIQKIDPAKTKPRTQGDWAANRGMLPRRVVQSILDAGYLDTLQAVDPAKAAQIGTFTTQFPGQRVDYIFSHSIDRRRIEAAWVEQDRLAKYASDHFPIGAQIAIG
jgi:endonuclease/exonuclease/phosphatase family metal-dependent hydrolase